MKIESRRGGGSRSSYGGSRSSHSRSYSRSSSSSSSRSYSSGHYTTSYGGNYGYHNPTYQEEVEEAYRQKYANTVGNSFNVTWGLDNYEGAIGHRNYTIGINGTYDFNQTQGWINSTAYEQGSSTNPYDDHYYYGYDSTDIPQIRFNNTNGTHSISWDQPSSYHLREDYYRALAKDQSRKAIGKKQFSLYSEDDWTYPEEDMKYSEEDWTYSDDDLKYSEDDWTYPEDDMKYQEEDWTYPEEDMKYSEDDWTYPEDDMKYSEEDWTYPEDDMKYSEDDMTYVDGPETCYDSNYNVIPGCECHESCDTCGYYDSPTAADDCIYCRDGLDFVEIYTDGTGFCQETEAYYYNPGTCYDDYGEKIEDCECDPSCYSCGYYEDPTSPDDCIDCINDDYFFDEVYSDGTGYCWALEEADSDQLLKKLDKDLNRLKLAHQSSKNLI